MSKKSADSRRSSLHRVYGSAPPLQAPSAISQIIELVRIRGFAELPALLSANQVADFCARLDAVYETQEAEFGRDGLQSIGEADLARCPLGYDSEFLELARHPRVLEVARAIVGKYLVLHLQNGVIVQPRRVHHQSAWHRDLPYQEFVSSRPLAVNIYICLEDFSHESGGTAFLPFSHREERLPSKDVVEALEVQPEIPAGSAIVFDSMIFHRAGHNSSNRIRRGVNQVFATGILRQQIDIPGWLPRQNPALHEEAAGDPQLRMLLGYDARTASTVQGYRQRRIDLLPKNTVT